MAEETKKVEEKKVEKNIEKKPEKKVENKKVEEEVQVKSESKKVEEKKPSTKKPDFKKTIPKELAIARVYSLRISLKQAKAVCRMITGKTIQDTIVFLDNVIKKKQPVKMTGLEVPHQKGKGIAGARFPQNAAKEIKNIVIQLKANAVVNSVENAVITQAIPNKASEPYKKGGRRAKRTHLYLEAKDKTKLLKNKK